MLYMYYHHNHGCLLYRSGVFFGNALFPCTASFAVAVLRVAQQPGAEENFNEEQKLSYGNPSLS